MRDSQRQKVYESEACLDWVVEPIYFLTIDTCQWYVDQLLESKFFRNRWPLLDEVQVDAGRSIVHAWTEGSRISLPRWARCEWVILHELSHAIVNTYYPDGAPHGREFCSIYLQLVRWRLGNEAWRTLKENFVKNKVRHRLPRTQKQLNSRQTSYPLEDDPRHP